MYGFPRLRADIQSELAGSELLDELLDRLHAFTGQGWEQEDDITLVALRRSAGAGIGHRPEAGRRTTLLDVRASRAPGNERVAMDRVAEAVAAARPRAGPPGTAEDRGQRDHDERDRVRHGRRSRGAGRDRRRQRGRRAARPDHRPALGGPIPGDDAEAAGPRGQARRPPEAARLGPVPHPSTWSTAST